MDRLMPNHQSHSVETQDPSGSPEPAPAPVNMPCTGPQDLDFLDAEHEALEAAGVPFEWRDALRRTLPASPEEGHPIPGGGAA